MWEINGWFWVCIAVVVYGFVANAVLIRIILNYKGEVMRVVGGIIEGMSYWRIAFSEVHEVTSNSDKKLLVGALKEMEKDAKALIGEV